MKRKALVIVIAVITVFTAAQWMIQNKQVEPYKQVQGPSRSKEAPQDHVEKVRSLGYVADGSNASDNEGSSGAPIVRKIVRSGELTLSVKSLDSFSRLLDQKVQETGGYIAGFEMNRNESNNYAVITLKLPPQSLSRVTWWLKEAGSVTSEKLNTEDISEQYYDLKARLENAHTLERRLQEMVHTQTADMADLLAVEEKLSKVRENIETMEATLRTYDHLVNLATLTLHVNVELQVIDAEPTYLQRVAKAWQGSTASVSGFIRLAGIAAVVAVPWLCLLIPATILLLFLVKVLKRMVFNLRVN